MIVGWFGFGVWEAWILQGCQRKSTGSKETEFIPLQQSSPNLLSCQPVWKTVLKKQKENFDGLKREFFKFWNGKLWQFEKENFDSWKTEIITKSTVSIKTKAKSIPQQLQISNTCRDCDVNNLSNKTNK